MNKRIRTIAFVAVACFALMGLQLANLQVRQASSLQRSGLNPSTGGTNHFDLPRGDIVSADGQILAYSVKTRSHGYVRRYPEGPLFAGITGYWDKAQYAAPYGLESEYDQYLSPNTPTIHNLKDILTQKTGTDSIGITVSAKLQKVAADALGSYTGAVVAIDPQTGAILAMYANPTYDPNKLSSPDLAAVEKYLASLNPNSGSSPLVNGAIGQRYPPGSTFKVITTATIFDHDPSLESINVPYASSISIPDTNLPLHNFADEVCGGNLARDLALSCDTAYAEIGLKLKAPNLYAEATAFGFNKVPPIDLPSGEAVPSVFPPPSAFAQNIPGIAYSSIGQEDVAATALQDALVAAAIGDGGTMMTPHLLSSVVNSDGTVVMRYTPHPWLQATSASTASSVRQLMIGVTQYGTAARIFPPSLNIAAKTGTAETSVSACTDDWLIATGPAGAGQVPKVAVAAVVVQPIGGACNGTGAEFAGPIVKSVLLAALGSST